MQIVMLSHTSRGSVFRVGSHHLAREFGRLGHEVVHVSNPLTPAHLIKFRDPEVRARARLAVPLRLHRIEGAQFTVPWSALPLEPNPFSRPGGLGSTGRLRSLLRARGFRQPDLLFVDQPLLDYLIEPINADRVIYRPTDVMVSSAARRAERRVVPRVAGVVATSGVVAARLIARYPALPTAVVENGVDMRHFDVDGAPWTQRRGAVYVGALDGRFDWSAVAAMGRACPGERIDLYGPIHRPPVTLPANVALRGPVAYDRLPTLLAGYRVGLLPLNDDPMNQGRSPMKLFEYLAGGLSVVARRTPAIENHRLADVHAYGAKAESTGAPQSTSAAPSTGSDSDPASALLAALSAPPSPAARAAATEMGWERRAQLVLDAVDAMRTIAPAA